MNYSIIKSHDIANGPGVRVSLFVSGCRNHCKGCFNPETWDFNYGREFTSQTMNYILKLLEPYYITGFTVLGGDPFEPENQYVVAEILHTVRSHYPSIDIWCYTGYLYDVDLIPNGKSHCGVTNEILECINTLVDGPFIEEEKDVNLQFRGSRNQRIIKLNKGGVINV